MSSLGTQNLQELVKIYEEEGELLRIRRKISPILIPAAIAHIHSRQKAPNVSNWACEFDFLRAGMGGKALLFENVEGSKFPLVMNLFGSYKRLEIALGCHEDGGLERIANEIALLVEPKPPRSFSELVAFLRRISPLRKIMPKRIKRGRAQTHTLLSERNEVNLLSLPFPKCWPLDGEPDLVGYKISSNQAGTSKGEGRYVTFAGVHTIHASERNILKPSSHNIGMYRMQVVDETKLAMHSHIHHDGAAHWRSWKKIGEPMPIAICFGGESVLTYAATAPLPPGLTEMLMAGYLRRGGIRLIRAKTVPLWIPAESEFVIEGWVSTESGGPGWNPDVDPDLGPGAVFEGPFGDHTGFYSLPDRYPIINVTAVTHCSNPILPATVVGPPPQEDYCLGKATERIFKPLLKVIVPDIVDYNLPLFGCFHNAAIVSIKKDYSFQANKIMHAIWGAGQMAWTKIIIVVDDSVNVHDEDEVFNAIVTNCKWSVDLKRVMGPVDILDHAAPVLGGAGKLGIDATPSWKEELDIYQNELSDFRPTSSEEIKTYLDKKEEFKNVVVPSIGKGRVVLCTVPDELLDRRGVRLKKIISNLPQGSDLLIAAPEGTSMEESNKFLFEVVSNFDSYRDLWFHKGVCIIDGGRKLEGDSRFNRNCRKWPPSLKLDRETIIELKERADEFEIDLDILSKED